MGVTVVTAAFGSVPRRYRRCGRANPTKRSPRSRPRRALPLPDTSKPSRGHRRRRHRRLRGRHARRPRAPPARVLPGPTRPGWRVALTTMPATRPTLGVSFWPDFAYDASGATTLGVVTDKKAPCFTSTSTCRRSRDRRCAAEQPPCSARLPRDPDRHRPDIAPGLPEHVHRGVGWTSMRGSKGPFSEKGSSRSADDSEEPLTTDATRGARRATGSRFGTVPRRSRRLEGARRGGVTMNSVALDVCAGGRLGTSPSSRRGVGAEGDRAVGLAHERAAPAPRGRPRGVAVQAADVGPERAVKRGWGERVECVGCGAVGGSGSGRQVRDTRAPAADQADGDGGADDDGDAHVRSGDVRGGVAPARAVSERRRVR